MKQELKYGQSLLAPALKVFKQCLLAKEASDAFRYRKIKTKIK